MLPWALIGLIGSGMVGASNQFDNASVALAQSGSAESVSAEEEDDDWGDDDDEAFAAPSEPVSNSEPSDPPPKTPERNWSLSLDGTLRSDNGVWLERFDSNGFAKARQSLDLRLEYKWSWLRAVAAGHLAYDAAYRYERNAYKESTLDAYELFYLIRDLFAEFSLGDFEYRGGYQIVAWGEGDLFSPLDVVNPRDMREFGLSDLDDLRTAVLASRLTYFWGSHRFELIVTHQPAYGHQAPPLGEFSPMRAALTESNSGAIDVNALLDAKDFAFVHADREIALDRQQAYGRWYYQGAGFDVGVYAASLLARDGVIGNIDFAEVINPATASLDIALRHPRYAMAGVSLALVWGSFLLKGELSFDYEKPFTTGNDIQIGGATVLGFDEQALNVFNSMLGVTYSGWENTTFSVEVATSVPLEDAESMLVAIDKPLIGLRASRNFMRERLVLELAGSVMGVQAEQGWFVRGEVGYVWLDGLKTSLGAITYQPGDALSILSGLTNHDRLWLKVRWDFAVF